MDLLDRINALTDEQLQTVAERDDASGVLASYRLAELRGLPMPDREAIITGEGYVIVAQAGVISRIKTDGVLKAIREGSFVEWNSSGGTARGKIERIAEEGSIKVPGIDFTVNAEPDNPAVLIRVWRKTSDGWGETDTLVGHKMSTLTQIDPLTKETFTPPQGVQEEGQRALDWIAEDEAGSGFTDVGRARAAQLARGDNLSEETIRRMANFLSRHESDKDGEGFKPGENGYPSPGRVSWAAWGGDPGKTWADSIVERLNRESEKAVCPIATQNVTVNLTRRKTAVEVADYGPLNPGEPNDEFWDHMGEYFETTGEEARNSTCGNCAAFDMTSDIQDCIAEGITGETPDGEPDPYDVIDAGDLGYCRVFKFKCASARTCSAWISGGPITDTVEEQKSLAKAAFLKKQHEQQFTLGPLYVPDFVDAHGEWTDAEELQTAVWGWVRSGDRRIFLQHDREIVAGEWVEVMTMPQEWTVNMHDAQGSPIGQVTYPPNTVFLGVIWNEESWELIKRGELRGYSIGGFSDRVFADLPEKAARDGLDMPRSEPVDLAKSIAVAVAEAMRTNQPIVNVVMSDERKARVRRIERDEHGNISRIVEEEEG
jgi:hypothetical protein